MGAARRAALAKQLIDTGEDSNGEGELVRLSEYSCASRTMRLSLWNYKLEGFGSDFAARPHSVGFEVLLAGMLLCLALTGHLSVSASFRCRCAVPLGRQRGGWARELLGVDRVQPAS